MQNLAADYQENTNMLGLHLGKYFCKVCLMY